MCFGKWCACATSLYLWPYTCSAHYVAGRGRVIPLKVTYHVTKNPNNTGEIGASVYTGKKPVKFRQSFKKSRCGGVFRFGFFGVFRGSCLATFNENPNARKIRVFWCQCKRHYCRLWASTVLSATIYFLNSPLLLLAPRWRVMDPPRCLTRSSYSYRLLITQFCLNSHRKTCQDTAWLEVI